MRAVLNYLFYCFYCLTLKKRTDRAEASLSLLAFFIAFATVDIYTLCIGLFHTKSHFSIAGITSIILAQVLLHFTYSRPRVYAPLVIRYEQGEPNRLRFALVGVGLLLTVIFLPFPLIKANSGNRL
jgi:hypothetical protein